MSDRPIGTTARLTSHEASTGARHPVVRAGFARSRRTPPGGAGRPVGACDIPLRVAGVYSFADAAAAHNRLAQGGVRGDVVIVS